MTTAASHVHSLLERAAAALVIGFARLVTGARSFWQGCAPEPRQRIYFGNHSSHGDFVLLWAAMPPALRRRTRPVAAADYWGGSPLRRFIAERVFGALLIPRGAGGEEAVRLMLAAIDEGCSLIIFPEGTRNMTEARLLPFRSGLYWLARAAPRVDCVPVWIANLNRVLPKGEFVPIPILCTLTFGAPVRLGADEDKDAFVGRARDALLALDPDHAGSDRPGSAPT